MELFIVKFLQSWHLAWHYLTSLYMNWNPVYNKPTAFAEDSERYLYSSFDLAALYVIKIHFKVDRYLVLSTWAHGIEAAATE